MSIPAAGLAAPPVVLARAAGPARAVWRNGIGGVTWRYPTAYGDEFCKEGPTHWEFDAEGEAQRLAWLAPWLPVPRVTGFHRDPDRTWFATTALPGSSAVAPHNLARPQVVVPALGRGLRRFHDRLPVADCRFEWSTATRIERRGGRFTEPVPPLAASDRVVCHGDACAPNFLLSDDGEVSGYVDLARCGVADRHADLAPALLSLGWNYGPGWDQTFLDAYGGPVDLERLLWYQRLWLSE